MSDFRSVRWEIIRPTSQTKTESAGASFSASTRKRSTTLITNYNSILAKISKGGRGIPIFEGHIDAPEEDNRELRLGKIPAVGRLQRVYFEGGKLWTDAVMNNDGVKLIECPAAPYGETSPHWNLAKPHSFDPDGTPIMRPVNLKSMALVDKGNLPGNFIALNADYFNSQPKNQNMNQKELAKLLGLPEDATEEQIRAKITELLNRGKAAPSGGADDAALNAALADLKTANDKIAELETNAKKDKVEAALNAAVQSGQITEDQKPFFATALNAASGDDLENQLKDLEKLPKKEAGNTEEKNVTPALNTKNALEGVDVKGKPAAPTNQPKTPDAATLKSAMNKYAGDHSLDLDNPDHHKQAFDACWQAAKTTD